ncbi:MULTISPECIES: DNA-packaging protein FI [Serratia]|uniref:Uncharacterized protein n=1 Tax=Serratia quinivorans TaxID=137545 RepID=A0A379YDV2_9GAMM|nr:MULTISPECIES: DNA-packaging protein FI [Serratia]RYM55411.1 hypothetical protein BSR03_27310 [Serratia proteamaculans]CAI1717724.1 Uncharacterised protein [Serratia quinivorans]SUI43924.1 Uncharacterised protein [Serratia quinivorans]
MNKYELITALNILSGQLGRVLSTEGNNTELQARLEEARAELELLKEGGDETPGEMDNRVVCSQQQMSSLPIDIRLDTEQQCIRLSATLDIWHYKKSVNKRAPNKTERVREIVSAGNAIVVDREEAELQIAEHRAVVV